MKRMWSRNELKEIVKGTHKDIATLVDAQGHERFIDGDITIKEISGITQTYGKWSLSGSHLLIVIGLDFEDALIVSQQTLTDVMLPDWIKEKLVPLYASNIVDYQPYVLYADDYTQQNSNAYLAKGVNVGIILSSITLTKARHARITFDLLIDND